MKNFVKKTFIIMLIKQALSEVYWTTKEKIRNEKKPMSELLCSFLSGDAEGVERRLNIILNQSISILDTKAKDGEKENFYHGLLVGLLKSEENWLVLSNRESGDGYADIIIEPEDLDKGMVIEVKYAQSFDNLENRSEEALSNKGQTIYRASL